MLFYNPLIVRRKATATSIAADLAKRQANKKADEVTFFEFFFLSSLFFNFFFKNKIS